MHQHSSWEVNVSVLLGTAVLSFLGSCMLVLCCVKYSKGSGISSIVYYLGLADIGWSLVGVISFITVLLDDHFFNATLCIWSRVLYQFFGSASVMWSTSISVYLYREFVTVRRVNNPYHSFGGEVKQQEKSMIVYHCFSWGVPLAQCIATYHFIEHAKPQPICLPRQPYFGLFWFLPMGIAIAVCIIVYMSFVRTARNPEYHRLNYASQVPLRVSLYILVMCICWIPDIVYYCVAVITDHYYAIAIVVNGLLELQGFLDCIVYGMVNKEFRSHFSGPRGLVRAICSPILVPITIIQKACIYSNSRRLADATIPHLTPDQEYSMRSAGTLYS